MAHSRTLNAKDPEVRARLPHLRLPSFRIARQPASVRQRRRANQKKEFTPIDVWLQDNFYDPTTINPVSWDFETARRLQLEPFQRDILRHVLTPDDAGLFPYRTIVWSQIKKSGKTTIAGAVGAYFAAEVEAPNVVLTVANDQEQSAGQNLQCCEADVQSSGRVSPDEPAREARDSSQQRDADSSNRE
jgi:hypothetical protein